MCPGRSRTGFAGLARTRRWRARGALAALVLAGLATAPARIADASESPEPSSARLAFGRFAALEGRWLGQSTAGWEEEIEVRVIAQGSVVMFTSFDAHPGETMVTMVSLDGERLVLTHYCVAGNQPRLEATNISADGRRVELTFVDAGNLASRDHGHMDSAVYELGDDRYSSRWTWYQDGEERWMEKIESRRLRSSGRRPAAESDDDLEGAPGAEATRPGETGPE